jgi:hypothetical protein
MGGSDEPDNLIELTIAEHADAHRILWEKYGKKEDFLAWKSLSKQIDEEQVQQLRSSIGGHNNKGKKKTEEHKMKVSESLMGKPLSDERKEKISKSMVGNTNFKKSWSEERRKLFSERMKLSHKQNPRCLEKDENGKIIGTKSNKQ